MANDGTAEQIKIPTFLVGKREGSKIKETIHEMKEDEIRGKKGLNREDNWKHHDFSRNWTKRWSRGWRDHGSIQDY